MLTLVNDVIGTAPRLQMLTTDAEANRLVEREFSRWSLTVGLAEYLRTMRVARAEDGESYMTSRSGWGSGTGPIEVLVTVRAIT